MTAARIRPATETDIPALVALEQNFPPEDRFSVRTWRRLLRGQSLAYVAVSDDEICGAAVYLYRTGTKVARLYSLTVAPSIVGRASPRRCWLRGKPMPGHAAVTGCVWRCASPTSLQSGFTNATNFA